MVGQLSKDGYEGIQTVAPPVENFWQRHCLIYILDANYVVNTRTYVQTHFSQINS